MRVRKGSARRKAKRRLFREASGNVMGRHKLYRTVRETIIRARVFAWVHRRLKKRDMRALWITRITAAVRARGMSYSVFIHGMDLANIKLNRKMLSEIAIFEPQIFDELVELAKQSTAKAVTAA
ncbi:MAG: 50S ribosomal protein L20 [Planctomycetota bacterium]